MASFIIAVVPAIIDGMLGLDSNVGGFNFGLLGTCNRWQYCCQLWPLAPVG